MTQKLSYTTVEAAESISVDRKTLQTWREKGIGPKCFKFGRQFFYPVEEIRRWLSEQCGSETAPDVRGKPAESPSEQPKPEPSPTREPAEYNSNFEAMLNHV